MRNVKMGEESGDNDPFEEDIVFDQSGLLNSHRSSASHSNLIAPTFLLLIRTVFLCVAFFSLGLCTSASQGPVIHLEMALGISSGWALQSFTYHCIGMIIGGILGSFMFDKYNRQFLIFVSLMWMAVSICVLPFTIPASYSWTALTLSMLGLGLAFISTGINVLCLDLWGMQGGAALQLLHFSFAMGAFICPFFSQSFMLSSSNLKPTTNASHSSLILPRSVNPGLAYNDSLISNHSNDSFIDDLEIENSLNASYLFPSHLVSNLSRSLNQSIKASPQNLNDSIGSDVPLVTGNNLTQANHSSNYTIPGNDTTTFSTFLASRISLESKPKPKPSFTDGSTLKEGDSKWVKNKIDKEELTDPFHSTSTVSSTTLSDYSSTTPIPLTSSLYSHLNSSTNESTTTNDRLMVINSSKITPDSNFSNYIQNTTIHSITSTSFKSGDAPTMSNSGKESLSDARERNNTLNLLKNDDPGIGLKNNSQSSHTNQDELPLTVKGENVSYLNLSGSTGVTYIDHFNSTNQMNHGLSDFGNSYAIGSQIFNGSHHSNNTSQVISSNEPASKSTKLDSLNEPETLSVKDEFYEISTTSLPSMRLSTEAPEHESHLLKPGTYSNESDFNSKFISNVIKKFQAYGVTNIHFVYIYIGLFLFFNAAVSVCIMCHNPRELRSRQEDAPEPTEHKTRSNVFIVIFSVYMFTAEAIQGAMHHLFTSWNNGSFAILGREVEGVSVFWGLFCVMRLLCVVLSGCVRLKPGKILFVSTFFMLFGTILFCIGSFDKPDFVWGGIIIVALGLAPVLPTSFLWMMRHMRVTHRMCALMIVLSSFGNSLTHTTLAHILATSHLYSYVLVGISAVSLTFLCFSVCLIHQVSRMEGVGLPSGYQLANQDDYESHELDRTSSLQKEQIEASRRISEMEEAGQALLID